MDKICRIGLTELTDSCLDSFDRYQEVHNCWRMIKGGWALTELPFIEDWKTPVKRQAVVRELRNTVTNGGAVFAYMEGGQILAFASVGSKFFGRMAKYLQLEQLHVSRELRGKGFGTALIKLCFEFAKDMGADKVYISGHSSQETQNFYKKIGCNHVQEINSELFYREPCDVHLEYVL